MIDEMSMLKIIREWIWPAQHHAALANGAALPDDEPATKKDQVLVPPEIEAASANLNKEVTKLRDLAVDTKIQSDILHTQITGKPPPLPSHEH